MRTAKVLSFILNPVVAPLYTLLILLNLDFYTAMYLSLRAKISITILIAISTFILPALSIVILKKTGFVSSIDLFKRKERTIPYIITAGFYYIAFHSLSALKLPSLIPLLLFGGMISILFSMIINFFWKISAHMMAMGGITGLFAGLSMIYSIDILMLLLFLIIISGAVAWSRIKLESHTVSQVFAGYALGIANMIAILLITK
jgi:hypothetical protein